MITRLFAPKDRGQALALWGATAGVATLVGPIAGGGAVPGGRGRRFRDRQAGGHGGVGQGHLRRKSAITAPSATLNTFTEHVQRKEVPSMGRAELRQATQSRVLAAADRLFTVQGFAATTIRDIATEAGVSVGTVIAVGDKDALLVQVFDGLIAARQHRGADAPAAPSPPGSAADPAQEILALVGPFVRLFTERAELARAYAAILVRARHSSTLFTELAGALLDEIEQVLLRSGARTADEAAPAARSLYFAYVGVLFSWAARADAEPQELPETLLPVFAAFFHTPEPSC